MSAAYCVVQLCSTSAARLVNFAVSSPNRGVRRALRIFIHDPRVLITLRLTGVRISASSPGSRGRVWVYNEKPYITMGKTEIL